MHDVLRFALALSLAACAAAPAPSRDDELNSDRTSTPSDSQPVALDGGATNEPAPAATPAAVPKALSGSLATGPVAAYGGDGWCEYALAFKDIVVDIKDIGEAKPSAKVKNAISETAPGCAYELLKPMTQQFTGTAATKTSTGWKIEFTPTTDEPVTGLTAEISPKGSSFEAQLTWKRLTQHEKVRFTATAKVPLKVGP